MTSWSAITLRIDAGNLVFDEKEAPIGLVIDKGVDEQGWVDGKTYYALSFGRYQHLRFDAHLEDMHCPKFSGVTRAVVCEVNDTDDIAEGYVYEPIQRHCEERADGYERVNTFRGSIFPDGELKELKAGVSDMYGIEPVIEPINNITPPDMIFQKSVE